MSRRGRETNTNTNKNTNTNRNTERVDFLMAYSGLSDCQLCEVFWPSCRNADETNAIATERLKNHMMKSKMFSQLRHSDV